MLRIPWNVVARVYGCDVVWLGLCAEVREGPDDWEVVGEPQAAGYARRQVTLRELESVERAGAEVVRDWRGGAAWGVRWWFLADAPVGGEAMLADEDVEVLADGGVRVRLWGKWRGLELV